MIILRSYRAPKSIWFDVREKSISFRFRLSDRTPLLQYNGHAVIQKALRLDNLC